MERVETMGPERKGRAFVVTSGKGGVGKTTVTANLGAALASLGYRVVLIDADIGLRNLDLALNLENRIVFDLLDVLEGRCRGYRQALISDRRFADNLKLLPAPQTREKEELDPEKFRQLVQELKEEFDFIFIDSPAGIEHGFKAAAYASDVGIVVVTPHIASIRDADRVIGKLEGEFQQPKPYLIVNMAKKKLMQKGESVSVEDILEILDVPLLGIVPYDDKIAAATDRGEPVVARNNTPLAKTFRIIAKRLVDPNFDGVTEDEASESGLLGIFKQLIKKIKQVPVS